MSIAAFAWATKQTAGGVAAKAVLRALADYADDTGLCWPSQATIAADTELTDRSVRDQLVKLERAGLISREEYRRRDGTQGSDRIRLAMPDCRNVVPISRKDVPPVQPEPLSEQAEGRSALTTFEPPPEPSVESSEAIASSDGRASDPVSVAKFPRKAKTAPTAAELAQFATWWEIYPLKKAKQAAIDAFVRIRRAGEVSVGALVDGASAYAVERAGRDPSKTAHPATWLNGRRWEDENPTPSGMVIPYDRAQAPRQATARDAKVDRMLAGAMAASARRQGLS